MNRDGKVGAVYFTKPASNTIVRLLNDGGPVTIATDDILGAKRDADPTRFTPVAKDDLIVQLPGFARLLPLGCPGLFPGSFLPDGLLGPFLGGSHDLRLNRIVFAGLETASASSQ
jgi:hypothetical protein